MGLNFLRAVQMPPIHSTYNSIVKDTPKFPVSFNIWYFQSFFKKTPIKEI